MIRAVEEFKGDYTDFGHTKDVTQSRIRGYVKDTVERIPAIWIAGCTLPDPSDVALSQRMPYLACCEAYHACRPIKRQSVSTAQPPSLLLDIHERLLTGLLIRVKQYSLRAFSVDDTC